MKKITISCLLVFQLLLLPYLTIAVESQGGGQCKSISTISNSVTTKSEFYLVWDPANPQTFSRETAVVVNIVANHPNFTWQISGGDFYFDAEHSQTIISNTESKSVTIYAGANACGPATITVTDSGGLQTAGSVRCQDSSNWYPITPYCPFGTPLAANEPGSTRSQGKFKVQQLWLSTPVRSTQDCEQDGSSCETAGCQAWCDQYSYGEKANGLGCVECVIPGNLDQFDSYNFPCQQQSPCAGGVYSATYCLSSGSLQVWEWKCNP